MSIIDNAIQSTLQKVAAPTRNSASEGLAGVLAANRTEPTPYTEQGAMLAKQLEGFINKQTLERAHTPDYDQNVWLENARYDELAALAANPSRAHFSDIGKKPNHITFSTESLYSGKNGITGGEWLKDANGNWSFTPSADNLAMHSPAEYKEYFNKYEPDSKLNIPMVYKRAINR